MKIASHPQARAHFEAASDCYRKSVPGLGEKVISEVERVAELIRAHAAIGHPIDETMRSGVSTVLEVFTSGGGPSSSINEGLIAELHSLKQRDVETRQRLLNNGRLYGSYDEEMQRVQVENAHALDRIVSVHGWPGISMVGLQGCRAAWFIAQHAVCIPALQRRLLRALEVAVESADAPAKQAAYLTDRVRFNEGKPQIYGTVFQWNERRELSCERDEPEGVDELRASVGLPVFQQSLLEHRKEIAAEGGKAPMDFQAYRKAASQWAKRIGRR